MDRRTGHQCALVLKRQTFAGPTLERSIEAFQIACLAGSAELSTRAGICRMKAEGPVARQSVELEATSNKMSNLHQALSANDSTRPALILPDGETSTLTFKDVSNLVEQACKSLQLHGVRPHDNVFLVLPNSLAFIICFLAITKLGAIVIPVNSGFKLAEFTDTFSQAEGSLCVVAQHENSDSSPASKAASEQRLPVATCSVNTKTFSLQAVGEVKAPEPQLASYEAKPTDTALLLYTSGTTGKPKAVPLSHANLIAGAKNVRETYSLGSSDRGLLVMPLFHIHGIVAGMLAPLLSGGSIVISSSVAPSFWTTAKANGINWFTATPTMHKLVLMLEAPAELPRLRFVRSCSSPLAPVLFAELERLYKCPVLEAYAMTENSHQMTSNTPQAKNAGSVGLPIGIELVILTTNIDEAVADGDKGEICVRGPSVMAGYLNNDEANRKAFTKEGFFRTGDEGIRLPDGAIQITGRLKELINKGGEKISPIEIDNLFNEHESVSEAVAFAVPDDIYGEDIGVAVALRPGCEVTARQLKSWAKSRVSAHKVPGRFFFPESIPKTATGKLQRLAVAKAMLEAK